jgi:S1-C subfamily serine protease
LRPDGAGALSGLKVGDLITHVGSKPVGEPADLSELPAPTPQAPVLLRVVRDGSAAYVGITGAAPLP